MTALDLPMRCLTMLHSRCGALASIQADARDTTPSRNPLVPEIGGWLDLTDRRTILIIDFIRIADSGTQRRNSLVVIHKTLMHGDAASRSLSMPTEGPRGTDLDP